MAVKSGTLQVIPPTWKSLKASLFQIFRTETCFSVSGVGMDLHKNCILQEKKTKTFSAGHVLKWSVSVLVKPDWSHYGATPVLLTHRLPNLLADENVNWWQPNNTERHHCGKGAVQQDSTKDMQRSISGHGIINCVMGHTIHCQKVAFHWLDQG